LSTFSRTSGPCRPKSAGTARPLAKKLGLLVYGGAFIAGDMGVLRIFRSKVDACVRVRLLIGDADTEEMARRCAEEQLDDGVDTARVRNTLVLMKGLRAVEGIEIRLHGTVLYNSLFCADEQLLVNAHIYGFPASLAPVLHFRRTGGTTVSGYFESVEKVWQSATPLEVEETMPKRYGYYNDPAAPPANSMVPSVNVVVTDDDGRLLMICRTDNGNWAVPGGAVELGESLVGAAVRETFEETGITCEVTGLVGIYTDPKHVIHYTSNGEVRQEFSIVLTARPVSGEPTPSGETSEVHWVKPDAIEGLQMDRSMRKRIADYLKGNGAPHLGD
jgi:8-oxo-dGTP pyrophosphatase MutT (NUDIX family)